MKKHDLLHLLYQLTSPVALMLLGLILTFRPDTASALLSRLLGWGLVLAGICTGLGAVFGKKGQVGKGVMAVGFLTIGGFLMRNPLILAAGIGRMLGILLIFRGIRDGMLFRRNGHGRLLALITVAVGIVLTVLPMTTSRLIFSLCGVVVLAIGTAMLVDRLKGRRYPEDRDPNIIDAL